MPGKNQAIRIALWYVGLSGVWIFASGWLVHHLSHNPGLTAWLEYIKGWAFVLVTAIILGWWLHRYFQEIRTAAQRLQEEEHRLRLIGDNLPDSYVYQYTIGPDGRPRFTYISAGVERVQGIKAADVLRDANCLLERMAPEERPAFEAAQARSARELTDFEIELRTHRPDGAVRLIHIRSRPSRNAAGQVKWDGFVTDITGRVASERALRESERLLQTVINLVPHPIFAKDRHSRYLFINEACAAMNFLAPEQMLGKSDAEFLSDRSQAEAFVRDDREVITSGRRKFVPEEPFTDIHGKTRILQTVKVPFESPDRGPALLAVAVDITELKRAEQELRDNQRLLTEMGRTAKVGGWDFDPASGGGHWTEESARIHGADPSVEPGIETILAFYRGDTRERLELAIQTGLASGLPYDLELELSLAGGRKWVRAIGQPVVDNGHVVRLRGSFQDITERKQAELALRESEEQFRTMFELASIGMAEIDSRTGRFTRVNRKLCEITGYSPAELMDLSMAALLPADDPNSDWEEFQEVLRGETPSYRAEKRFERRDGQIIWVNVNATALLDATGETGRTLATVEDITHRRLADEERMHLTTALEQAAESIVITDLTGMILYVNPAFERITGYPRREVIGQNPRILNSGRHETAFFKAMWDTLGRGEVWHGHFINQRKDGTLYEEEATISPLRDAVGKIVNYMAIKLDVTREVELEGQFRQSQKLEAIGQLAGGVAHDFNNILTSILMQVELAGMETSLSQDVQNSLHQIRDDADRAARLTQQLLLFSRRQIMQSRDLNLNETLTALAKMLQRIIGEDVHLQLNLHPQPLLTHADAGMLDQVVMNLAVNARDAMPNGGRLVIETSPTIVRADEAGRRPDATPGAYVCLTVRDTGTGIPPEIQSRIFEPFFTTKEVGKGTGLGLATVFGIVKQHRGWVTVESQPGEGATFRVFLPAITRSAVPVATGLPPRPTGGTETILLAEDDAAVRKATVTILRYRGYAVLEAATGPEARQLWQEHHDRVALLLTDLVMPGGVSGRELAQQLQAEKPGLKVIFASGYSAEMAGREIKLHPGENFLQKPFRPEDLFKIVRASLDA